MTQQGPNVRLSTHTKNMVNKLVESVAQETQARPTQNEIIANAIEFARAQYEVFSDHFRYTGQKFRIGDEVLLKMNGNIAEVVDTFKYDEDEMATVVVRDQGRERDETDVPVRPAHP
jgi:Rad3-related DNA helicase